MFIYVMPPPPPRELQALIDSTSDPSSPFHIAHALHSTDTTVYSAPSTTEPDSKKRKLDSGTGINGTSALPGNDTQHAKHPGLMKANKHMVEIHEQLKRECEVLAELCVSIDLASLV